MSQETHQCSIPSRDLDKIVDGITEVLHGKGMRRTEALEALLAAMIEPHRPYSLAELCEKPGLKDRDQATVYRLVNRLQEIGVMQQLSFGGRGNCFQLVLPGHHHDYLHCRNCGRISEVPVACRLDEVEDQISEEHGWRNLSHSLAFHGECPDCAED